jgi:hypothetical protein
MRRVAVEGHTALVVGALAVAALAACGGKKDPVLALLTEPRWTAVRRKPGRPVQFGPLAGFLPPSAMYRFDLRLKRADRVWRVAEAGWKEVPPAPDLALIR